MNWHELSTKNVDEMYWCQTMFRASDVILLIIPLGTNFIEIETKKYWCFVQKIILKLQILVHFRPHCVKYELLRLLELQIQP